MKRRTRARTRRQASRTTPRRRAAPPGGDEEARLLGLARDLAALLAEVAPDGVLNRALARLAEPPGPAAPRARGGDSDAEGAALALGWAREQARLALRDVVEAAGRAGAARTDVDPDTLAWLLLAAGEALAREPAGAVPDRLRALRAFLSPARGRPPEGAAPG